MANDFAEIDKFLDRIRSSYDSMMEHLPKAAYLKRAFEDRYLESLKNKTNLLFFLKGEEEFLEPFIVETEAVKSRKEAYKERNEGGFAENVLKEIHAGIADYPILESLDEACIKEVSRLYGATHQYLMNYWDSISYFMRGINSDVGVKVDRMERSLLDVYSAATVRPPKGVELYNEMVRNNTGTSSERIRAAQDSIQYAGIWLNNLRRILELSIYQTEEHVPKDINTSLATLSTIITDFRLKSFAKRKI